MSEPSSRIAAAFTGLVERVTPRCRDITKLLSQAQDRPLPWSTRQRIRLHYRICVWCERYGQHLARLRAVSRDFPEKGCAHLPGPGLPPAGRERLATAVRRELEK